MKKFTWGEKSLNTSFPKHVHKTNTIVPDDLVREIYKDYLSGMTMVKLSEKYKKSAGAICNLLKRRGLRTRSCGVRKHGVDERFFEVIDTEEKAYLLGLIFADGHVGEKVVVLKMKSRDKDILEKMNKVLDSGYPIGGGKYLSLRIYSPTMAEDLRKHGLHSRKTWDMPDSVPVPSSLIRHFFRGLFDGDGSVIIFHHKRERKSKLCLALSGGDEVFLRLCDQIISRHIGCNTKKIQKTKCNWGNSYLIKWHDKQALRLNEWLYEDASIYLERKYENARQFFGKKTNRLE